MSRELRTVFERATQNAIKMAGRKPCLLLSTGFDSGMIAESCQGIHAVTGYTTQNRNILQLIENRVQRRSLHWYPLHINVFPERVERMVSLIAATTHDVLKTIVECAVLMVPVLETVQQAGHTGIIWGMAAGECWGVGRQHSVEHAKGDVPWTRKRIEGLLWEECAAWPSAGRFLRRYAESIGLVVADPFRDPDVTQWFMSNDWDTVNKRGRKGAAVDAFPELKSAVIANLQSESMIRETCEELARKAGFASSLAWYNHMKRKSKVSPNVFWGNYSDEVSITRMAVAMNIGAQLGMDVEKQMREFKAWTSVVQKTKEKAASLPSVPRLVPPAVDAARVGKDVCGPSV